MVDGAEKKHDVFISYSSRDKKWADAACEIDGLGLCRSGF